MNVREVIEALQQHPQDANVYAPSIDGKVDIVKNVSWLVHLDLPEGINIPDDVVLYPWDEDEFEELFGKP